MKNQWEFNDYEMIKPIKVHKMKIIIFLTVVLVGVVIVLLNLKLSIYQKQTLIKNETNYSLIVDSKDLTFLEKNRNIYINSEKYEYEIDNISSEYNSYDNNIYQSIAITISKFHTDAILSDVYFLKSNSTIFEKIVEFLKGGVE